MKNITSKNPIKSAVVEALKKVSGASKVTQLQEDKTHYRGTCFAYEHAKLYGDRGQYKCLGVFSIEKSKVIT